MLDSDSSTGSSLNCCSWWVCPVQSVSTKAVAVMAALQHTREENGFLGVVAKLRNANMTFVRSVSLSVCPSVRMPEWNSSDRTGWIFVKICMYVFFGNIENIQVSLKSATNNGTSHADRYTVMVTSRSDLLRMRNVSDESCRENQKTYFVLTH